MRSIASLYALGLSAVLFGCGGAGGGASKPLHTFPSREQLAAYAASSQSQAPIGANLIAPEAWRLELPAQAAENPGHVLLPTLAPHAQPSPAFDCVAHELAHLLVTASDKRPSLSLNRFISARCGALVAAAAFQSWIAQATPDQSDAAIAERLKAQLQAAIAPAATQAGVGFARDAAKVVVVLAFGSPEVAVEPFEQVVGPSGALEIRGRVAMDVEGLRAFVNSGEYGVASCELDPAVAAPAFALSCPLAPGDDSAWVQLLALPRGRALAHEVLGVLALRTADAATSYVARRAGEPREVADAAGFGAAALELLNGIRAQAGMPALVPAPEQTRVANSVTPAFFGAMLSEDPAASSTVDSITLGLLAGWEVTGGIIREGDLTASVVIDSHDAERWLGDALERPASRAVLLDPDARVLALGALLQPSPSVLAAVATTYAFFEPEAAPGQRAAQLLERLGRVRQARGLGGTVLVRDTPGVEDELARIRSGEATPTEALQSLMENVAASMHTDVQGFVWETHDLDAIEFPSELLRAGQLVLGAGVTYHRAKGGAWGQYTVLFVVLKGVKV